MSSIAPSDSVSSTPKKSRPGKRERQQARSAVGSSGGVPASASKAKAFAAGGMDDPIPQPGKFPVVFQTGVGEPTRDQEFAFSPDALESSFSDLSPRYSENARFAEFREYSGQSNADFQHWLTVSSLLRLAQQSVHAHVNLGLPQGDFAAVASSDVLLPSALSVVIQQFGELSIPSTGTRFLLADYQSAVKRLVFCASHIDKHGKPRATLSSSWFPQTQRDGVTKLIVARALNSYLSKTFNISFDVQHLEEAVLSGARPPGWDIIKDFLEASPPQGLTGAVARSRFDFLFEFYSTSDLAVNAFTANGVSATLGVLGLRLDATVIGAIRWTSFNTKQVFSELAEKWARTSAAYAQFFELSSGLANRSSAKGSLAQFAQVSSRDGVVVLRTSLAISAPELSLAVCFPPTALVSHEPDRRVIVTTSLNVSQRATEFCLKDWR